MNKLTQKLVTVAALLASCVHAAEPQDRDCNQLGREIALRAAEQMPQSFDSAARTQLAAIAESACIEFGANITGAPSASVAGDTAADENGELFDLDLIEPQDRVRRPGLKRR